MNQQFLSKTITGDLYPLECNPRAISAIHLFQDSDKIVQTFFNQTNQIIYPKSPQNSMLSIAMILYGLPEAIASSRLGYWWGKFTHAKDAIWSLSDPLPFLHFWIVFFQFWRISYKHGISLQQACTQDIEWDGL